MPISHKGQVVIQFLVPVAIGYLTLAYFLLRGAAPTIDALWNNAGVAALLAVAGMLVQDLIPKPLKEGLVFFRARERLPSHRAFSPRTASDARLDSSKIDDFAALSALPPSDQSRAWYKSYLEFCDQPTVQHYSVRYLGWRDTAAFAAVLAIVSLPAALTVPFEGKIRMAVLLTAASLALYALSVVAARSASKELLIAVLLRMERKVR